MLDSVGFTIAIATVVVLLFLMFNVFRKPAEVKVEDKEETGIYLKLKQLKYSKIYHFSTKKPATIRKQSKQANQKKKNKTSSRKLNLKRLFLSINYYRRL